jgi:hypothetical protein
MPAILAGPARPVVTEGSTSESNAPTAAAEVLQRHRPRTSRSSSSTPRSPASLPRRSPTPSRARRYCRPKAEATTGVGPGTTSRGDGGIGPRQQRPPGERPPPFAQLRLAPSPDGDPLQRQAHLRRDEPCCVVLVLRPDVAHHDQRAVGLDRPTRLLGCRLERRSVHPRFEALGQRHVERLRPRRMVSLGHAPSLRLGPPSPARVLRCGPQLTAAAASCEHGFHGRHGGRRAFVTWSSP